MSISFLCWIIVPDYFHTFIILSQAIEQIKMQGKSYSFFPYCPFLSSFYTILSMVLVNFRLFSLKIAFETLQDFFHDCKWHARKRTESIFALREAENCGIFRFPFFQLLKGCFCANSYHLNIFLPTGHMSASVIIVLTDGEITQFRQKSIDAVRLVFI